MDPKTALQILDTDASAVQLNRADHSRVQQAINVLMDIVNPKQTQGEPKKEVK